MLKGCLNLIVLVALLGLIGLVVINYAGTGSDHVVSNEPATPAETVSYTAKSLFAAYDANEVATDIALKGKMIEVSGAIQAINKSVFGTIYVTLVTDNQFLPAAMHVVNSEESKMAALRKGQYVVFRCPKMQRWVGSPSGTDCVLASR